MSILSYALQLWTVGRTAKKGLRPGKDLRNHGESPHSPIHNYQSMAEDLEQFMQEHHLLKPTIIGHSMSVTLL